MEWHCKLAKKKKKSGENCYPQHNIINVTQVSLMATSTSFSPTASVRSIIFQKQNPPKALLLLSQQRSFASSASYATLKLPRRPLLSKGRTPLVRAATIEEIEAEKAAIEKDAVINFFLSLNFSFFLRPSIL